MSTEDTKSGDVFGIRPAARAVDRATEASISGASAFLSRICLPAAEEFGLLLKDRVSHWRAKNAAKIAQKAEKLTATAPARLEAHPRLAWEIIEKGSWADDEMIQDLWAGLLATSCMGEKDDSNILFAALLEQITSAQVRIISYVCESAPKYASKAGFPFSDSIQMPFELLSDVTGVSDLHRIDRELDHLRSLDLISSGVFDGSGFGPNSTTASVQVTPLALHLYTRGHGFPGSPVEYWKLKPKPDEPNKAPEPTPTSVTPPAAQESRRP